MLDLSVSNIYKQIISFQFVRIMFVKGCISRFKIGHSHLDILSESLNKTGTTNCETCGENKCENQGACQEALSKEGYTCICPIGFSGPTCNKLKGEACSPCKLHLVLLLLFWLFNTAQIYKTFMIRYDMEDRIHMTSSLHYIFFTKANIRLFNWTHFTNQTCIILIIISYNQDVLFYCVMIHIYQLPSGSY